MDETKPEPRITTGNDAFLLLVIFWTLVCLAGTLALYLTPIIFK